MVARRGIGHGLTIWFDTILGPGVTLSNGPGAEKLTYGHAFFPWGAPVALEPEDAVSVLLRADLVGEEYVWTWKSRVLQQGRESQVKAQFTQSTLHGRPCLRRDSERGRMATARRSVKPARSTASSSR